MTIRGISNSPSQLAQSFGGRQGAKLENGVGSGFWTEIFTSEQIFEPEYPGWGRCFTKRRKGVAKNGRALGMMPFREGLKRSVFPGNNEQSLPEPSFLTISSALEETSSEGF